MKQGPIRILPEAGDLISTEAVFVMFLYSGRFKNIPELRFIPIDLTLLLGLLLIIQISWSVLARRVRLPPFTVPVILALLFSEYAVGSLAWSSLTGFNTDKATRFAVLTVTSFFVASALARDPERRTRLVRMIALVSCGILFYYAYNRFLLGNNIADIDSSQDALPGTPDYMAYAEHAALLFMVCLTAAVLGSALQGWLGLAGMAAALLLLVMIGGRGQLVIAIASIPALGFMLLLARARATGQVVRLGLLVFTLVAVAWVGSQVMLSDTASSRQEMRTIDRMQAQLSGEDTSSVDDRSRARAMAFEQWLQRPWFGWGIGEFQVHDRDMRYPHNLLLEILMELGLVGAVLYLAIAVGALFACVRAALHGPPDWPAAALMLFFLMDFTLRMTVQGYLADDRMHFSYLGGVVGMGAALRGAPCLSATARGRLARQEVPCASS